VKRKTVQQYLEGKIHDEEFDLVEMLEEIAGQAVDEQKLKFRWQKVAGGIGLLSIIFLTSMFGIMFAANEVSKEAKSVLIGPDHAEFQTDGTRIRCASADIAMAADGTTMVRESCSIDEDGGTCTQATKTSLTKTFVPLIDLPRQSTKFLENIDQVMYNKQDGSVVMKKLSGFEWHSPSHMELRLAGDDATLFIKNGTAWIAEKRSCNVQILQQRRLPRSRRLQGSLGNQAAFTHAELIERYNGEIALLDEQGPWRRLDPVSTDGLAGMAGWFGAIFRADMSSIEANEEAMQDQIDASGCDVGPPSLPNVGTSGYMLLKLRQQFGADADLGTMQLLYFGLRGTPKFKLAQRVTLSFDRDSWMEEGFSLTQVNEAWPGTIAVTELRSGQVYSYEVSHPAHPVLRYMTFGVDSRIDTKVAADKSGLLAAMYVLESSNYDGKKRACTVRSPSGPNDSGLACSAVALDGDMPFDCDKQLFRWRAEGWILETKVDGEIVGLSAGHGKQRFEVEEVVRELGGVSFNGCSESSSDPLTLPVVPDATGRRLTSTFPPDTLAGFWERDLAQHQQGRSATFWCGSGTVIKEGGTYGNETDANGKLIKAWPCPEDITEDSYAEIGRPIGSFEFIESTHEERIQTERACMRHDHGAKSTATYGGAVVSGCDIDAGLVRNTANSVVQLMFGDMGMAQIWGCWDLGQHPCWRFDEYWNVYVFDLFCEGHHIKYGPTRYLTYQHSYGWDQQTPPNRCVDVLPWETGCITPEDC
jgi:hypothetical protein